MTIIGILCAISNSYQVMKCFIFLHKMKEPVRPVTDYFAKCIYFSPSDKINSFQTPKQSATIHQTRTNS